MAARVLFAFFIDTYFYLGGLELEGVEVRVQISDQSQTKVEELIPKQVTYMHTHRQVADTYVTCISHAAFGDA